MRASRGMGAIAPSKMPKGTKTKRRDDTDFTQYAEGGKVTPARMSGMPGPMKDEKGKPTRKALALKKWKC
jgi:hypothetical protein